MNVTTPSTLVNTLRARIVGLTPSGGTTYGERASYRAIEDDDWMEDPERLDGGDLDRGISVHGFRVVGHEMLAGSTWWVVDGRFTVSVGHIVGSYQHTMARRDLDVQQIMAQVAKPTNLPTGVMSIDVSLHNQRMIQEGTFWWTDIEFRILYGATANYGG